MAAALDDLEPRLGAALGHLFGDGATANKPANMANKILFIVIILYKIK